MYGKETYTDLRQKSPWDKSPREKKAVVIIGLAVINLVVYLVLELMGSTSDTGFMYDHGALSVPAILQGGQYWRLLTAAFLHFGASHLMNNLLAMYVIGERLEKAVGHVRVFLVYGLTAVLANIVSVWYYEMTDPWVLSAGASGAVMGLSGAMFAVILKRRSVGGIDRRQMMILLGFSLYSGFVSGSTNNAAHISGLVFGFILGLFM